MIRFLTFLLTASCLLAACQNETSLEDRLSTLASQITENQDAPENAERIKELGTILEKLGGEQYISDVADQIFNDTTGTIEEERAQRYIEACEAYAIVHKGTDKGADFLYMATETLRAMGQPEKCLAIYDQLIAYYPDHKRAAQALYLKGSTYDNDLGDFENARKYYEEFLAKYPNDEFASYRLSILTSLITENPDAPENAEQTKELGTILEKLGGEQYISDVADQVFNDTTGTIDEERAQQYIEACEAYAIVHKGTDKGADYLYKATETLRAMRQPEKCLAIYDQLIADYPDHKRAAQALFLKGFTYDNDLGDFENARKYYEEFLAKYPNDEFASSAEFLLENLGKSDDELLQVLQAKNDSLNN